MQKTNLVPWENQLGSEKKNQIGPIKLSQFFKKALFVLKKNQIGCVKTNSILQVGSVITESVV